MLVQAILVISLRKVDEIESLEWNRRISMIIFCDFAGHGGNVSRVSKNGRRIHAILSRLDTISNIII